MRGHGKPIDWLSPAVSANQGHSPMKMLICVAITAIALTGCNDTSHEPADGNAAQTTPTASLPANSQGRVFRNGSIVSDADFVGDNVQLTVTPNPYDACVFPKGEVPLSIAYDATGAGARHTQIWFQRSNGKQVLWGQAPGKMAANSTGKWAHEGMKVLLVEAQTGKLLGISTIHAHACAK
jgi:hypothetical protein